jgi:PAS domain S-box-containing protein
MTATPRNEKIEDLQNEVTRLQQHVAALEERLTHLSTEYQHIETAYHMLVDHSLQGLAIFQDSRLVLANTALSAMSGYTIDELCTMLPSDILALIHPEDRARVHGYLQRRRENKPTPSQYVFRIIRKDKEVRWLEEHAISITYRGKPARQSIYMDITERKQAEQTLRWSVAQQEEYYRALVQVEATQRELEARNRELHESQAFINGIIEHSPTIIYVKDIQTWRTLLVNQRCASEMGRQQEEIIGKTDAELFPPELVERWRANDKQVIESGTPVELEEYFPHGDNWHTYLTIKFPLRNAQGNIYALGIIAADITERKRAEEALRESETRYRSIFENATIGIFQSTPDGKILAINQAYATMLGYDSPQDVMQTVTDVAQQLYVEPSRRFEIVRMVVENQGTARLENRYWRKDGTILVGNLSLWVIRNDDGTVRFLEGFIEDITERKQAEDALRESEARYRSIFENATIGIFQTTPDGQILNSNPALAHMLGYDSPAQLLELVTDVTNQLYVEPASRLKTIQKVLSGNDSTVCEEHHYRCRDGSVIIGNLNMWAVRDEHGNVRYLEGFIEDITERKQAEDARERAYSQMEEMNWHLQQNRDILHTIINGIHDGLVLLNQRGSVVTTNMPLADLLNTTPEELTGQAWDTVCTQVQPPFPGNLVFQTLSDARSRRRRERFTAHNGQVRILDMQTLPLLNLEHTIDQVILHIVDVTENLQLETLMIEHERFEASGRLAATVAHEINSPLQTIRNFLYLAEDQNDPQHTTYLQLVRDEIDRVGKIVHQLLNLFRPDNSVIAPVDMNTLIERVLLLMSGILSKHCITTEINLEPDLPMLQGRADQLTQVLHNIITNAIDAMPRGGTLRLRTATSSNQHPLIPGSDRDTMPSAPLPPGPPSSIIVEISDTGIGINATMHTRIFESFFTTKQHGTGLGLAISQKIIEQHRGIITVHSNLNQGSTFVIVLPLELTD